MAVDIELFGQLLPGTPRRRVLDLKHPVTVRETAHLLGLNPDDAGLVTINGVQREMEDVVPPHCRLCFFPYMTGG